MPHRSVVVALALLTASAVGAQSTRTRVDPATRTVAVTINPFALFAEYVAGDVEVRVSPSVTLGGGSSVNGIDDFNGYRSLEVKARYYPGEMALQGFSVAATAGFASADDYDYSTGVERQKRTTRPTIGTELSYQWILGPSARFVTVVGLGLKRYLGTEGNVDPINIPLLPTARINIGAAF